MEKHKLTPEIKRERDRAFRLETTLKKALRIAADYKKAYQTLKKENLELKKALNTTVRQKKRIEKFTREHNDADSVIMVLSELDQDVLKKVRRVVRMSFHPDKYHSYKDPEVKNALSKLFIILEGYFKNLKED